MATGILAIVGATLGGTKFAAVGAAIGATIGGIIDNQIIRRHIIGDEAENIPPAARLQDLQLQTAYEGSMIKRCYGPENRVAGTVLYVSEIDPSIAASNNGVITAYKYSVDIAIAICEGPVNKIKKIWAEDKLIYDEDGIVVSFDNSNQLSMFVRRIDPWGNVICVLVATTTGPDLTQFYKGEILEIRNMVARTGQKNVIDPLYFGINTDDAPDTGIDRFNTIEAEAVDPADWVWGNGHWKTLSGGGVLANGKTAITIQADPLLSEQIRDALSITDDPLPRKLDPDDTQGDDNRPYDDWIDDINYSHTPFDSDYSDLGLAAISGSGGADLYQLLPPHSEKSSEPPIFRLGTSSQTTIRELDTILDDLNLESIPYRNIAWCFLENFNLRAFGNRIPNISFFVEEATTRTVASVVQSELEKAGVPTANIDVSGVSGNCKGYHVSGIQNGLRSIEPLMTAYDLIGMERDGKITVKSRQNATEVNVTTADLAAGTGGDADDRPMGIEMVTDVDIPREVNVQYPNPNVDYLQGNERARAVMPLTSTTFSGSSKNAVRDVPVVMTPDTARSVAARILWETRLGQKKSRFTLPPEYADMQEGDLACFDGPFSQAFKVLISKATMGANYVMQYEGAIYDKQNATQPTDGSGISSVGQRAAFGIPTVHLLDAGSFQKSDAVVPGVYVAGDFWDQGDESTAIEIHTAELSDDVTDETDVEDSDFSLAAVVPSHTTVGFLLNSTEPIASPYNWDRQTVLRVQITAGTLTSASEEKVMSGRVNLCQLGQEIIAFATATQIDVTIYELRDLLRGLRGTESASITRGHEQGTPFTLVDLKTMQFLPLDMNQRGTGLIYRVLSEDIAMGEATTQLHELTFGSLRPLPPIMMRAERLSGGSIRLRWQPRSRGTYSQFQSSNDTQQADLNELDTAETVPAFESNLSQGGGLRLYKIQILSSNNTVRLEAPGYSPLGIGTWDVKDLIDNQVIIDSNAQTWIQAPVGDGTEPLRFNVRAWGANSLYGLGRSTVSATGQFFEFEVP